MEGNVGIDDGWQTNPGDVNSRADLRALYGGSPFGGIEPSSTTPNILVFTDPAVGSRNGYDYDGWDPVDTDVFYYTGTGRQGDQRLDGRNGSVLRHAQEGRTLRLFEAVASGRAGGVPQRYVGAFELDATTPYRIEPAPDAVGQPRDVVVFHLRRIVGDQVPEASRDRQRELSPAEAIHTPQSTFDLEGRTVEVRRTEGALVHDYARSIDQNPQRVHTPAGPTDLLVEAGGQRELIEAKSSVTRSKMREAAGQLLDYASHCAPLSRLTILVPDQPSPSAISFLHRYGIDVIHRDGPDSFRRHPAPEAARAAVLQLAGANYKQQP